MSDQGNYTVSSENKYVFGSASELRRIARGRDSASTTSSAISNSSTLSERDIKIRKRRAYADKHKDLRAPLSSSGAQLIFLVVLVLITFLMSIILACSIRDVHKFLGMPNWEEVQNEHSAKMTKMEREYIAMIQKQLEEERAAGKYRPRTSIQY
mmetsp:Transcript_24839/g.56068  ORF Transcript_24839/g.56068 Transcript_24839/m.56068 type:complete len:154 (-) Transcript_24839:101-562(-)